VLSQLAVCILVVLQGDYNREDFAAVHACGFSLLSHSTHETEASSPSYLIMFRSKVNIMSSSETLEVSLPMNNGQS